MPQAVCMFVKHPHKISKYLLHRNLGIKDSRNIIIHRPEEGLKGGAYARGGVYLCDTTVLVNC